MREGRFQEPEYTATANHELEGFSVLIRDFSGAGENRSYTVVRTDPDLAALQAD